MSYITTAFASPYEFTVSYVEDDGVPSIDQVNIVVGDLVEDVWPIVSGNPKYRAIIEQAVDKDWQHRIDMANLEGEENAAENRRSNRFFFGH